MTERSYPFVDGPTTDAEFSAMFRLLFPSSVHGYPGSNALQVYADSTGLKVKLRAGAGFVRGHRYVNDAELELAIDANASGSMRIDTVVLHLEYAAVKAINAVVVKGTPGEGAPSLTATENGILQYPLADVAVASGASTIAPANVTDRRTWWGVEFMKSFGLQYGTVEPAANEAFLFLKKGS